MKVEKSGKGTSQTESSFSAIPIVSSFKALLFNNAVNFNLVKKLK